ncbi:DNA-binding NarL/FixJ family response regulator [Sinorhizobium fredii]|uniref:Putative transcriptional regulator protein, LuxR family n=1 Tax=Sinorhizobium fredii (strain USDA 257) TaxID=1185652 RepID=I3X284_SINF2|nr:putative transcriptional regulator protein, LuxR family [Sinorhizobium fredii USDA 257]
MALRNVAERGEIGAGAFAYGKRRAEPRRVILIVSSAGSVSERLIEATEREFPWVLVEQVDDVDAACRTFSHPVSLLLVDIGLMKDVEGASTRILRLHPQSLTAVIEPHGHGQNSSFAEILGSPLVRGMLPMNVKLDVWLSVIRLMLCGGAYFPPELMLQASRSGPPLPSHNGVSAGARIEGDGVAELTARELQILEMVSRGLQNKLIAAEFRLSEHTVKIHLHNIITKLGAHNRTEAAARYRNFQDRKSSALKEFRSTI